MATKVPNLPPTTTTTTTTVWINIQDVGAMVG